MTTYLYARHRRILDVYFRLNKMTDESTHTSNPLKRSQKCKSLTCSFYTSKYALIFTAIALYQLSIACSAEEKQTKEAQESSSISTSLGAAAFYAPKFSGSKEYQTRALPVLRVEYGRFTLGGAGGMSYDVLKDNGLKAGISMGYFSSRSESDAPYLQGLGDISSSADLGLYIEESIGPLSVSANIKRDFSDDVGGVTSNLALSMTNRITPQFILNTKLQVGWMNKVHGQALYGVDSQQASASELPETDINAGFEHSTLSLTALYFFTRQWVMANSLSVSQLVDNAKSSPITREDQPIVAMNSLSYRF